MRLEVSKGTEKWRASHLYVTTCVLVEAFGRGGGGGGGGGGGRGVGGGR